MTAAAAAPIPLTREVDRERVRRELARKLAKRDPLTLDGPTLAKWCAFAARLALRGGHDGPRERKRAGKGSDTRAVTLAGKRRKAVKPDASDAECEALAAAVAEYVLTRHGVAPSRESVNRSYLAQIAHSIASTDGRIGREWRDSAATYRTRSERENGCEPMLAALPADLDAADPLAAEVLAQHSRPVIVPVHALDVADWIADKLAAEGLVSSDREALAVRVALARAGMAADGGSGANLAALARDLDCSLVTVKRRSGEGARLLAALGAGELARYGQRVASALNLAAAGSGLSESERACEALATLCVEQIKRHSQTRPQRAANVPSRAPIGVAPAPARWQTATGTAAALKRRYPTVTRAVPAQLAGAVYGGSLAAARLAARRAVIAAVPRRESEPQPRTVGGAGTYRAHAPGLGRPASRPMTAAERERAAALTARLKDAVSR